MINLQNKEIADLYGELQATRTKLVEAIKSQSSAFSGDYTFSSLENNAISFNDLFGDRTDLILIHNMGEHCRWCMLWADGLNGLHNHIEQRSAIVLVNQDSPEKQQAFASSRGWTIPVVCDTNGQFTRDMGFGGEQDGQKWLAPGVSTFHKADDGTITHVSSDMFGPGDMYMPVYPLFALLKDGEAGWEPQYKYQRPVQITLGANN